MRASRSARRSLPGFSFDMALRDIRRPKDPLFTELVEALQRTTSALEALYGLKGVDPSQSATIKSNRDLLAKVGG